MDEKLLEYATERQREILRAVDVAGSAAQAAHELQISERNVFRAIARVKKNAALHGYSPEHDMTKPVPEPFVVKGESTLYSHKTGKPVLQWVKTKIDDQKYLEMIADAVKAFTEDIEPIAPQNIPLDFDKDIIPWVEIGDAHLGLLCHAWEVGQNFDLKIAEREMRTAFKIMFERLPNCERMVLNDLGDFTHYENIAGVTEASGNVLDKDGRFPKMISVYSRLMRWIVDEALTKARTVDVIINQGNHSRTNDIWMVELLRVAYEPCGRVNVLNNGSPFISYRMGNTLVMTHHGDLTKARSDKLPGIMMTDFREAYGDTEFHYIDTGHIHHKMAIMEHQGIVIEAFNHLAVTDKWAYQLGYRSRKSMTAVLRSRTYGEIGRYTVPVEQIRDRIIAAGCADEHMQTESNATFVA